MLNPLIFGRNICALRESKKLTEYELSIQVDIDSPQLNKVELGKQLPTAPFFLAGNVSFIRNAQFM